MSENMNAGLSCVPERESQISAAFNQVAKASDGMWMEIDELVGNVTRLTERIDPILRPADPSIPDAGGSLTAKEPVIQECGVAAQINALTSIINRHAEELHIQRIRMLNATERVEL